MIDDDTTNGDGHSGRFTHRKVAAGAPVEVPPGAVSSPFTMARQYAGGRLDLDQEEPESPAATPPAQKESPTVNEAHARAGKRGPHMVTRAKETLKSCGPLTLEQFAEGLGIDMKKARTLAKNGIQKKLWKREQFPDGEKLVLLAADGSPARQSGLKHYLRKQAGVAVDTPSKARGGRSDAAQQQLLPAAPPPPEAEEGAFGLFSTGEFRIEYGGQEMRLPRKVTKAMVAYLDKIASAFEE